MCRAAALVVIALALAGCPGGAPVVECSPSTNKECHAGYTCDPISKHCLRSCANDDNCLAVQSCDLEHHVCRESTPVAPDSGGGDPTGGDPTTD